MKGWLDKYGEEINANEGYSSAPKEWMGEGYSNVGRDYSPAWGGQFQKGGNLHPIYTSDPNDSRLRAYKDSVGLYNSYVSNKEMLDRKYKNKEGYYTENITFPKNPDGSICYKCIKKEADRRKAYGNFLSSLNNTQLANPDINPKGYINYLKDNLVFDESQGKIYDYSNVKPKQQVIYKPSEKTKVKKTPIYTDDLKKVKVYNDSLSLYNSGEDWYNGLKKLYFDKEGHGITEENLNKLRKKHYQKYPIALPNPNDRSGKNFQPIEKYEYYVSDIGNIGSNRYKKPVQPVIYKPKTISNQLVQNFKPKDKPGQWKPLTKEIAKGRFSGDISNMIYRETGDPANPYNITGIPSKPKSEPKLHPKKLNVQPIPLSSTSAPQFSINTRQMPKLDVPPMQQGHYRVEYFDPSLGEETHRRFMSQSESDAFAKELSARNLTSGVPAAGNITQRYDQFAMGGSVGGTFPGSTGFMYARTNNPAPSNGPYAKKTKASAQNGMTYYQNGLDWKPKSISRDGSSIPKAQTGKTFEEITGLKPITSIVNKTDIPLTTQEKLRKEAEAAEIQRRNIATNKRQFVGPTNAKTKESEARRKMLTQQAVAGLPNVQTDQFGNTSAINPNMTYTGQPANFMGERQQKAVDHIAGALEAAGYITGAAELGQLGYGALKNALANSMEKGILSKLRPKQLPGSGNKFILNDLSQGRNIKYEYLDAKGNKVATFSGTKSPEGIYANAIEVAPEFRRKGAASNIYRSIANDLQVKNEGTLLSRSTQHQFTDVDELGRSISPANKMWEKLVNTGEAEKFVEGMSHTYKFKPIRGYKEVPIPSTSYGNIGSINSENSGSINFSNYLTQEEAVKARAQRMLEQQNKWAGQDNEFLKAQFETAHLRHDPAANYNPEALGTNRGDMTLVSKYAPLSDANKARIAAHETGHYYSNAVDEANEWNSLFDFENLSPKTRAYLKGTKDGWQANYPNQSLPPRTSGLSLWKPKGVPGGNEIRERAAQLKDYIAQKNNIPLNKNFTVTEAQLDDAIANYTNDTGLDNVMSEMLSGLKDKKGFLKAINKYALGVTPIVAGAAALQKQKKGGVVKDNNGYWNPDNWGEVVEIDSPDITMQGVDQDLIGISDEGDIKYMTPGKDYKFKGKKVREYPVGKNGVNQQDEKVAQQLDQLTNFTNYNKPTKGGWLDKYN